jgi:hypothetical protein
MTMAVAPTRPILEVSQDSLLTLDGTAAQMLGLVRQAAVSLGLSLSLSALAENLLATDQISVSIMSVMRQRSAPPRLALVGRVLVKVTTENGAIHAGDLLVSASRSGYAMRCEGAVIGKVLEARDEGMGIILMLIMR